MSFLVTPKFPKVGEKAEKIELGFLKDLVVMSSFFQDG